MNNKLLTEEIGSMLSLMQRMDSKQNFFEAAEKKRQMIKEVMTKASTRKQVTRDEIFDVLEHGQVGGGQFVALTYVCGKSPIKQKVYRGVTNWKKDEMSAALSNHEDMADKQWHKDLTNFNDDNTQMKKNPVANIIAVQRYLLHWTTPKSYAQAYETYKDGLSTLRMRLGIGLMSDGMLGDNHNQRQRFDGGGQANQNGNLSKDFNMAGSHCTSTAYLIDDEGNIIDEIPNDVMKAMTSSKEYLEKDVRELSPEQIEFYKAEKKELAKAFRSQTFNYDGILSIVASADGQEMYYINDTLSPSKIQVNQEAFVELAKEQLGASFDAIHGFEN